METMREKILQLGFLISILFFIAACGSGGGSSGGSNGGGSSCAADPTGTVAVSIAGGSNNNVGYSNTLNFINSGGTNFTLSSGSIVSLGAVCGTSAITSAPSSGFVSQILATLGNGYIGKFNDGTYIAFYPVSWNVDVSNNIIGVNVKYIYPFTPSGTLITQTYLQSGTFIMPYGVTSVTVQAWGGGGYGGPSYNPYVCTLGSGGGGGGGYATATFANLTGGQSYAVTVGSGGNGGLGHPNGGDSNFLTLTAGGGGAGGSSSNSVPGNGGTGGTSSTGTPGNAGMAGSSTIGGNGGSSPNGGTGGNGATVAAGGGCGGCGQGANGNFPGGGGGGGMECAIAGAGASGEVIISY